ncbi:AAA family ATPase [Staphylococcus auricularis]|uniref:AAA family ATPase n=1 Tax=Staphylococcus auricularis TaxID=29379 RepID=A0AAW7MCG6_9STAP|nr:AAA family ATPase [Staphylococcus auricularis]MDC6327290.1 AAA family ATPase [Staphylococcus auricularis]MDN4532996.1 AAA family ATPase [Staphylococcus auricularis]
MYEINDMTFKYKKTTYPALKNISFKLSPGVLNVLVGENGAEKTTLMDCMAGMHKVDALHQLPPQRDMIYMTQNMFFTSYTTGQDIIQLIKHMGSAKECAQFDDKIKQDLEPKELDKLDHLSHLSIGKMSEGEKKWLYITLLSALNRKLYLFDEPTSGVDPRSRKLIIKRLKALAKDKTVLISTHQLQDLYHSTSQIIFIHDGKKIYDDTFDQWLIDMKTEDPDKAFEDTISQEIDV